MEFYFPTELGEQLAYCAAAFTALVGLVMMFAPGVAMRAFGLQQRGERREGYAEMRSTGGFYLGFGLSAIMLAQSWIYMALGASFVLAIFGRILSMMSDRGNTLINLLLLVVQAILAALLLLHVFAFFE